MSTLKSNQVGIIKLGPKDCFSSDSRMKEIRAIIGIGNPGPKFDQTRHNAGFAVIDGLAKVLSAQWQNTTLYDYFQWSVQGESARSVIVIKPLTFVNLTGKVAQVLKSKGIGPEQILVIHDDLERPLGSCGIRFDGSAKGHNGLKSVIEAVGSNFWRMAIGIGRPGAGQPVDQYVISRFAPVELEPYKESLAQAVKFFVG